MWTSLPRCDVLPGDRVEVLSHFGQFDPGLAMVEEVLCNRAADGFVFRLKRGEMTIPQEFSRDHFGCLPSAISSVVAIISISRAISAA